MRRDVVLKHHMANSIWSMIKHFADTLQCQTCMHLPLPGAFSDVEAWCSYQHWVVLRTALLSTAVYSSSKCVFVARTALVSTAVHNGSKCLLTLHLFCNRDETPGSDSWAVQQGWVSVTPLGLKGDITTPEQVTC